MSIPPYFRLFQRIPAYSRLFHPISAYSSQVPLFQPIPDYSRLFPPNPAFSRIFQPILASSSLFKHIEVYFNLFQPIPAYSYEALSDWGSRKVFLDIVFKIQENLIIMICNTIDMLFIVYNNTFLQKNVFFPHDFFLHSFMVIFSCLIIAILA